MLALALGGSSDVIGAMAWARASGYEQLVLVQPGSPPRGAESPSLELQTVQPAAPGTPAPGGSFFDNGSMVAYLLSLDATQLVAGYYLVQPKDDGGGKGFSRASLEGTTAALVQALAAHKCSALVGLDFGGDVAIPEEDKQRSGGEGPGWPCLCQGSAPTPPPRVSGRPHALPERGLRRLRSLRSGLSSLGQTSDALAPAGRAGRTSSSETGSTCSPPSPQPSSTASRPTSSPPAPGSTRQRSLPSTIGYGSRVRRVCSR